MRDSELELVQSVAWMLLLFFMVALVAHVIMRSSELKWARRGQDGAGIHPTNEQHALSLEQVQQH